MKLGICGLIQFYPFFGNKLYNIHVNVENIYVKMCKKNVAMCFDNIFAIS